jgi:serine/threonine protein phosphatase PrpC
VSRSFVDPEAKISSLGGNTEVLITVPEIKSFKINKNSDFMIIGYDGIFDWLDNCDIVHSIWSLYNENLLGKDINEHFGKITDIIIRNCLASNANHNLTCIFVCFEHFKNLLYNDNNYNNNNSNIISSILNNLRNIYYRKF